MPSVSREDAPPMRAAPTTPEIALSLVLAAVILATLAPAAPAREPHRSDAVPHSAPTTQQGPGSRHVPGSRHAADDIEIEPPIAWGDGPSDRAPAGSDPDRTEHAPLSATPGAADDHAPPRSRIEVEYDSARGADSLGVTIRGVGDLLREIRRPFRKPQD